MKLGERRGTFDARGNAHSFAPRCSGILHVGHGRGALLIRAPPERECQHPRVIRNSAISCAGGRRLPHRKPRMRAAHITSRNPHALLAIVADVVANLHAVSGPRTQRGFNLAIELRLVNDLTRSSSYQKITQLRCRGKLPTCVVKIRSSLRCMADIPPRSVLPLPEREGTGVPGR